eukprot:6796667-Prymnesium_polylepis.1
MLASHPPISELPRSSRWSHHVSHGTPSPVPSFARASVAPTTPDGCGPLAQHGRHRSAGGAAGFRSPTACRRPRAAAPSPPAPQRRQSRG